jgi:hypothetical protein
MQTQNYNHLIGQQIIVDYSTGSIQSINYQDKKFIFTVLFEDGIKTVIYKDKNFIWID